VQKPLLFAKGYYKYKAETLLQNTLKKEYNALTKGV